MAAGVTLEGSARAPVFVGVPAQVTQEPTDRRVLTVLHEAARRADADGAAADAAVLRSAATVLAQRSDAFLARPTVQARCFGSFGFVVGGDAHPLTSLRPRARTMLRLLSAHAGRPVHRDLLLDALWPTAAPQVANRSMMTTLSSVRGLLALTPAAGSLRRDGQSYVLDPAHVDSDVAQADHLLREARRLRESSSARAADCAGRALDLYVGDLLSEEGPAEWVVEPRERWRQEMAAAAHLLAVQRYRGGDFAAAAAAARRGLHIDRSSDPLWRVLVAALSAGEDVVAAERAAAEYDELLLALAV